MTRVSIRLAPQYWTRLLLGVAVLAILLLGTLTVRWAVRRQDQFFRDDLLYKAFFVAHAIPMDRLQAIDFNLSASSQPEYQRLKTQLLRITQIDPAWKRIYLLGRHPDGQIFFQMSSHDFDTAQPTGPGQVYRKPPPCLAQIFDTRSAETVGPQKGPGGVGVSVYTPVIDSATGQLITVMGIDVDVGNWHAKAWRAGLVPGLLTFALISILLIGYALLGYKNRNCEKFTRPWRHLEGGLIMVTGTLLTLGGVWVTHLYEARHQHVNFLAMAHLKASPVVEAFQNTRNFEIESLGLFFESSEEVKADEFRSYTSYLNRASKGLVWGWLPLVTPESRQDFVHHARQEVGADFDLWEHDAGGQPIPAPERPRHFPLLYLEPTGPAGGLDIGPGFDLASLDFFSRAFPAAAEKKLPFASDPIFLGHAVEAPPLVLIFRPVYTSNNQRHLDGFVMGLLEPQKFIQSALNTYFTPNPLIHMELVELQEDAPPVRLAATFATNPPPLKRPPPVDQSKRWILPILTFGRTYAVVATPSPEFFHQQIFYAGWLVLLGGLSITAVLALLGNIIDHRHENLERLVEERTRALASSMHRYEDLARYGRTLTWEADAQGVFVHVSDVAIDVWGFAPDELIGKRHVCDLHPEQGREAFTQRVMAEFHARRPFRNLINPVLSKSGQLLWMSTNGIPILDDQGALRGYQGFETDITTAHNAEQALRESRRQYAALVANLPGMAYRCANDPAWTMEFVSDGCRELTGYAPEDLIGNQTLAYSDLMAAPCRTRVWGKWQDLLPRQIPFEDEYEITTRTGETKWVWEKGAGVYDDDGRVLALEGFIVDVTERKRAGLERERLMAAIEQSDDAIVITDAEGTILYVNPAFSTVTGYSRQEALGQNPRILQSASQDRNFYQEMWQTLTAGRTWRGQLINKRKDGTLFTEVAAISPVRDADGGIVQFVAVKRDITQQLRDQQEREALQSQLLQAQKMESIGRLAGGIAHDFNNMLQAILGYTELSLEQVSPDQPLHADLIEIQKAAQRSKALTQQLQAFARKQPVRSQNLDLNAAIENMLGRFMFLLGERIHLDWKPAANLGWVQVDPSHLDQLVTNLCINARDAIAGSGTITIETRHVHVAHPIRNLHGDIPVGDYVRLSVTDTGCGMGPDVLEHIFEPFFTTKKMGMGTGLGLATTYGIIQQNSAIPRILSHPGIGTDFQIFFPRQLPENFVANAPDRADTIRPEELHGTETILIVEDEITLLQTTQRMLEALGYTVQAYPSAAEALEFAEANPDAFDLLLTDVMMPNLSGPKLIQRLLVLQPKLRYLYMSGYAGNLFDEKDFKNTNVPFIRKPFSRTQLAYKIRDVLNG